MACSHVQNSGAYYKHGFIAVSSCVRHYPAPCHVHGPSQGCTASPGFLERPDLFYYSVWRRCKIHGGEWFAVIRDHCHTNVSSPVNKNKNINDMTIKTKMGKQKMDGQTIKTAIKCLLRRMLTKPRRPVVFSHSRYYWRSKCMIVYSGAVWVGEERTFLDIVGVGGENLDVI